MVDALSVRAARVRAVFPRSCLVTAEPLRAPARPTEDEWLWKGQML